MELVAVSGRGTQALRKWQRDRCSQFVSLGLAAALLVPVWAGATVVTDNNLTTQSLGSLSATAAPVNVGFTSKPSTLNGVSATVQSLANPFGANTMYVDAIAPVTNPTVPGGLYTYDLVNQGSGLPYGSGQS